MLQSIWVKGYCKEGDTLQTKRPAASIRTAFLDSSDRKCVHVAPTD
jgi:hypothetical protein